MQNDVQKRVPSVAVITGGHPYDVPNFHRLFRGLPDTEIFIQSMDDFACSPQATRQSYDVVLFYHMLMDGPANEGLPWFAGQPKAVLEQLGLTEQGIIVLHHALLAYPQWPVWDEIVGITERKFGYHVDQALKVEVASAAHPITRGLHAWEMRDETYTMPDAAAGSEILLTTQHPKSMRTLAWARQYRNSRVFCLQSGHDNVTWANKEFQEVLRRGINWCARRA